MIFSVPILIIGFIMTAHEDDSQAKKEMGKIDEKKSFASYLCD